MSEAHCDAIVFFGATGDLAFGQIFPALPGLVREGGVNVPIVGVDKAGWGLDAFRARARNRVGSKGRDHFSLPRPLC